jgi:glycosyltransferase involved in cell wall biosynthesis
MISLRIVLLTLAVLCGPLELFGGEKKTVCLDMIVKNEKEVISACLDSVKPLIDYWVIVDTGSTDGTQEFIKEYMKEIPGELHERPWKNFAHNRNEALELARGKADYLLIMDADDYLEYDKGFKLPELDKDSYYVEIRDGGSRYSRRQLVTNQDHWKWIGVLHEAICSNEAKSEATLSGIIYKRTYGGARSKDPQKFQKDAQVLEDALKEDSTNSRYMFYLAQSYRDAKDYETSIKKYEQRIQMGGWDQEVYWSMLQIALMKMWLGKEPKDVIDSFYRAHLYRPSRAEALFYLGAYYRSLNSFYASYSTLLEALKIPLPEDILFVERWVYEYGAPFEASISAYWVGKYAEAKKASERLMKLANLPDPIKEALNNNMKWINSKLAETQALSALKTPTLAQKRVETK